MTPDPERLALARRVQPEMSQAIRESDAAKIKTLIAQGKRAAFTVGGRYRIFAYGAPPEAPLTKPVTVADGVGSIVGMDVSGTIDAADVFEIFGTYRGRVAMFGQPHEFRADDGKTILLGDIDVLSWERA